MTGAWPVGRSLIGGLGLAVQDINADPAILRGKKLRFVWRDDGCDRFKSLAGLNDMLRRDAPIDGLIGPGCAKSCEATAALAQSENLPQISATCAAPSLSNKDEFPFFVRTTSPYSAWAPAIVALMRWAAWARLSIVGDVAMAASVGALRSALARSRLQLGIETQFEAGHFGAEPGEPSPLLPVQEEGARIVMAFAFQPDLSSIAIEARQQGMSQGWAWLGLDVVLGAELSVKAADLATAQVALHGWVYFAPSNAASQAFFDRVKAASADFGQALLNETGPNVYAANMYDAVMLFAKVTGEHLDERSNGSLIVEAMKNASFDGITGRVELDSNGDMKESIRVLNYVREHDGTMSGRSMGVYHALRGRYAPDPNCTIIWPGGAGSMPQDAVVGTDGIGTQYVVLGAMLGVVVLVLFGVLLAYQFWWRRDDEKSLVAWRKSRFKSFMRLWDEGTSSFTAQLVTAESRPIRQPGSRSVPASLPVTFSSVPAIRVDAVDVHGYIPLHCVLCRLAPARMVKALIDAFPSGPSIADAKQNLALHLAIVSEADVAVVKAVYFAYPNAALATNSDGKMPLELLIGRYRDMAANDWMGAGAPDEQAIVELIRLLAFPLDCQGRAENWFHLLQLEDEVGFDGGQRWRSATIGSFVHMASPSIVAGACHPDGTDRAGVHRRPTRGRVGAIGRIVSAVLDMASERSVTLEALAYARDAKGRLAIDVATLSNKRLLWQRLLLLGRYEKRKLLHISATSRVWEVEDKEAADESLKILALKQIQDEANYIREISIRAQYDLGERFVAQVVRRHAADRILLMPYGECSFEDALSKEHFVGLSAEIVRSLIRQLVDALLHLHSKGIVHGDLKGKNICRFGTTWKLIDFDSAAEIGGVVGAKIEPGQSPSNVPPELSKLLLRAKFSAKAIRSKVVDGTLLEQAHNAWEACLTIVEELDRQGLDPLMCTLSGAAPSYDIWGLGLICFRLFTAARLFNSDEHEELDAKQLCKLVLWRGIQPAELRQRVFSKAEAGTVPNSEKDSAVELVAACLRPEPTSRPQSIDELLKCSYLRSHVSGVARAKLLFVSTPGKGFDPRTGEYDFDVMGWLQELCRSYVGRLVVAYDWAGSSSADSRDQQWFDQIFDHRNADGLTLFDRWRAAPTAQEKEALVDAVQAILHETRWLSSYKGSIKAQIRETCQAGAKAILVRLEGGPITRVEARVMGQLMSEARSDLAQLGVSAPQIELYAFDTLMSFGEHGLPGFLCDIYGDGHEPIPTSLLAALPPHEDVGTA
jgi:ABC-type branched-subunit amino acid transport system substrate-binding protein/serine/threonine protein kinase